MNQSMHNLESKRFKILLGLVVLLVLTLTTYKLNSIPHGFQWDEAAYGYNAYSLMQTFRDEWGKKLPLFLKSFGDFKPSLLSYAIIPFFLVGGVNQAMARLPAVISAIVGLVSLVLFLKKRSPSLGLITGFIFGTNPWFLHYARISFDPMPSLGFMLLGLWLWDSTHNKVKLAGSLSLLLSMYLYNAARFFVPILILFYSLIFEKQKIKQAIKQHLLSWVILLVGSGIILLSTLFGHAGTRAKKVFFWDDSQLTSMAEEGIYRNRVLNMPLVRVFNNKGLLVLTELTKKYASHFSPEFILPFNNQTTAFSFNRQGNFYLLLIPFLIIGVLSAYKRNKTYWFFLMWLITAPIPSTLTIGSVNPNRCLIMVPALCFFASRGILTISYLLQKKIRIKILNQVFYAIVGALFLVSLVWYVHDWLIYFPESSEPYWHGFYQQASKKIWNTRDKYEKVYFTNTDTQPYIFFSWYNQIDPSLVQKETANRDLSTLEGIKKLDNVYFWDVKSITTPCYLLEKNVLVVASANDKVLPLKKFPPDLTFYHANRFHPEKVALRGWQSDKMTLKQKKHLEKLCNSSL
jgi:hypothetical protein